MYPLWMAYNWSLLVPSALLLPVYAVTFHRVWNGTRYKLVLMLITLLTLASCFFFIFGIGQYGLLLLYEGNDNIKQG